MGKEKKRYRFRYELDTGGVCIERADSESEAEERFRRTHPAGLYRITEACEIDERGRILFDWKHDDFDIDDEGNIVLTRKKLPARIAGRIARRLRGED